MATQGQIVERRVLAKMWRQWSDIVCLFARQQRARDRMDRQAYHELYTELLAAIREHQQAAEPSTEALFRRMEKLLVPWVSLGSLQFADREVTHRLMLECRAIQEGLDEGCGIRTKHWFMMFSLIAGIALTTMSVGRLLGQRIDLSATAAHGGRLLARYGERCVSLVTYENSEERLVLLSGIAGLVLMLLAWSARKFR
ncbi:MAG: hypothetical protein ACLQNE_10905 [Thermoguttaceae bacterium]